LRTWSYEIRTPGGVGEHRLRLWDRALPCALPNSKSRLVEPLAYTGVTVAIPLGLVFLASFAANEVVAARLPEILLRGLAQRAPETGAYLASQPPDAAGANAWLARTGDTILAFGNGEARIRRPGEPLVNKGAIVHQRPFLVRLGRASTRRPPPR
jgi:hypothetical protein